MPRWVTHTEGGGWLGGGTVVANCSESQQAAITAAFSSFIALPCLNCFPGLADCLRGKWPDIEIDCGGPECAGVSGVETGGSKIWVCDFTANQVGPTVLHELTHACGGGELDAVAVENACFFANGALNPSLEWDTIKGGTSAFQGNDSIRIGRWAIWNTQTGEVFGKTNGGMGGRCFQHDTWIHAYAGGGGWL
jgi:hypothetical protein